MILQGAFTFDYVAHQVTDGTTWYTVRSLNLWLRMHKRIKRKDTIRGTAIIMGKCVLYFRKEA